MKLIKTAVAAAILSGTALYAECVGNETVEVNFRNLKVEDFIEMVSKITQKNILIEEKLSGTINFLSQKPIKKCSLIPLANSILAGKNLTLIEQGDYFKVVKTKDASGEGLNVTDALGGETMETVLFTLKHNNASVIRAKLKPLLHSSADMIAFKEKNMLAVTARPNTMDSISRVIHAIEADGAKKSTVVKLKHANVKDIFNNISTMAKSIFPKGIESESVNVMQDQTTNSIVLVGKEENMQRMIEYIRELDQEGESSVQKMYVIELKNSNVEEMEKILSTLITQLNAMAPAKTVKKGEKPSKAMVVSDVERNALVVLATSEQIKNIRETVQKIDVPKAQVYVQARIVEINTNLADQIGMGYGFEGGKITSKGLFSAAANMGASSLMVSNTLLGFLSNQTTSYDANGNPYSSTERAFQFDTGISEVFALGAQLNLLEQNGAAHILSEPSVLCTNNKEASIEVGQTQSILTQAQQSTQGQGNIINNYSREDIGITLKVKPRLSSNNKVTLEVEAEIEDILPGSSASADRPTTTKRKVTTNAIVNNGETIILGGLMKKAGGESVSKIPLLGDIPILGETLFGASSDAGSQINVVVYLTPYIVRTSSDLQTLRTAMRELDEIQTRYNTLVKKGLEEQKVSGGDISHPSNRIRHDDVLELLEEE